MKNRLYLLLCVILCYLLVFSACEGNTSSDKDDEDEVSVKVVDDIMDDNEDTEKDSTSDDEENLEEQGEENGEVESGDIVFTGAKSIVFEYYVEDPLGKTTMKVTMSDGFVRMDIPDLDAVGVINTNDDTGFLYYNGWRGTVSMSFYNLGSVETIAQLNIACENVEEIENLERTTLDGRDCIYGELEDSGDVLKLWYSQEYEILLQYIMDSSEGISTMKVTSIKEFDGNMDVFELPAGCIDLGTYDAEGEAFTEFTGAGIVYNKV